MPEEKKIFVIGHRNPDTDSICSAIAYAELRRQQGLAGVIAARAGTVNQQTQFILDSLEVEVPQLLADVYPRIKDVVTEQVVTIHQSEPMSKAIELYHQHHIRTLPVVDDDGHAVGLLLLERATEFFLVPTEPEKLRRVNASISSIQRCLGATAQHLFNPDQVEEFNLHVGARREVSFSRWVDTVVPGQTILITGDRSGIQRLAVEAGVRLLIISGNVPVDEALLETARKNHVSILVSHLDTANCVWLTRIATPVGLLAESDFMLVKPNDLLDDLRLKLTHGKQPGAIVCSAEGIVAGVATKSHLIKNSPIKLVLVDHNELSQAVPGADKVEIIEVIDHHRLGNFHTDLPIRFINQPLGSTCSLVATLYQQAGIEPTKKNAGLLLAGLLSDTVILKSPTTTDIDRNLIPWLEKYSGLDHQQFGSKLFAAGSPMASGAPARKLIYTDFKEYGVGPLVLGLGQVEVVNFHSFHQRKDELMVELQKIRKEKGYELAALLVTDIVMGTSLLLTAGPSELPYIISYPQESENIYRLKGVLSRKKQLVPHLLKVFKGA
ncbi:manganese-dependent inorganic pyrophosphatase [Desulfuromusa kysingii]|uniref:inorganic diphosphatase n=1 Tax=Desulfuromusa kysingii TaxID=37625 RepID=A0A1H3YQW8_9BACT|nr:putative manganese-dependent inorganic diphosphatase [Desulfuromusa kysingii]SEA13959.1 manganese-dependent inorganic pyrophosphatase [Desulfuromusa kysingii]